MKSAVLQNSDEWDLIEFALRLRTRSSRVNLLQAWNITNPESLAVFNTRAKNGLILDTFINAETLDGNNSIQDVCTRGFDIGSCGFKVNVGNIRFVNYMRLMSSLKGFPLLNKKAPEKPCGMLDVDGKVMAPKNSAISCGTDPQLFIGEKHIYEYFVCDVAIGKSIVVANELEAQRLLPGMPVEYDSFYIQGNSQVYDSNATLSAQSKSMDPSDNCYSDSQVIEYFKGVLPQDTFNLEYIILDTSQILPRYLIQFECDLAATELYALPLCDNCQDEPAIIFCPSDEAKVCPKCDVRLHSENKVVSRHIRVPLDKVISLSNL
ncbi:B-box-type zinc finger [Babesia duncani]|uniref:B-box-type zinc finger n=1 Tax=Babesia duncani TaxID=323732 RepID=A0AAD9PNT2_9APIC|nr:B-box-type zinc finger [Babesia duncani]